MELKLNYEELLLVREALDIAYDNEWLSIRKEKLKKLYNECDFFVKYMNEHEEPTFCTCWCDYPNVNHKKKNGEWKCIDNYELVKNCSGNHKTKCVKRVDNE